MKVTTYIINEGADDQEVILINAKIPSASMEKTIMTGDRIFGFRMAYGINLDAESSLMYLAVISSAFFFKIEKRIDKLEEKLQDYENAWKALRKIFQMSEK